MTVAELLFVVSATDVAVTVIARLAATVAGALYIAELVVMPAKLPQAAPVSPEPEQLHVTPLLLESFSTAAVNFNVCP
jgi:hypothetical protein